MRTEPFYFGQLAQMVAGGFLQAAFGYVHQVIIKDGLIGALFDDFELFIGHVAGVEINCTGPLRQDES